MNTEPSQSEQGDAAAQDWPYEDAQQGHPISEKYRIPVVGSLYPRWRYHVALLISDGQLWTGLEPTDQEAAQLGSYLQFWLTNMYRPGYIDKMRERPFDIDSGTATRIFLKRGDGSWAYRQCTWQTGTWPYPNSPKQDHTLVELLDHIESIVATKWQTWKTEHPDVFPTPETPNV